MKKNIIYILFAGLMAWGFSSCSEDDLSGTSVFNDVETIRNDFDKWIDANYTTPYNIQFMYRYSDNESDMNYNLTPADYYKSIRMSKMIQYLILDTYDEITGDSVFMRTYYPKILHMVGCPAYQNNGNIVLATAENGYKITIYNVNFMPLYQLTSDDVKALNLYYFKTLHHEFMHILHQTIDYSTEFDEISGSDYVGDSWASAYPRDTPNDPYSESTTALQKGFISSYAAKAVDEDFVEVISMYVTSSPAEWQNKITLAGESGSAIINSKLKLAKEYLDETWGLDIEVLHDIVQRRQVEVLSIDLDNIEIN